MRSRLREVLRSVMAARAAIAHGLLLLLTSAGLCGCGEKHAAPNVLLIVVDTLRADRLGCYGAARPTSPAIDALETGGFQLAWGVVAAVADTAAPLDDGLHIAVKRDVTGRGRRHTSINAALRRPIFFV